MNPRRRARCLLLARFPWGATGCSGMIRRPGQIPFRGRIHLSGRIPHPGPARLALTVRATGQSHCPQVPRRRRRRAKTGRRARSRRWAVSRSGSYPRRAGHGNCGRPRIRMPVACGRSVPWLRAPFGRSRHARSQQGPDRAGCVRPETPTRLTAPPRPPRSASLAVRVWLAVRVSLDLARLVVPAQAAGRGRSATHSRPVARSRPGRGRPAARARVHSEAA
jgi:hypothetical protein